MLRSLFGSKSRDTALDDAFRERLGIERAPKSGELWIATGGVHPVAMTVEEGWADLRTDATPPAGDQRPVQFAVIWNADEQGEVHIEADTREAHAEQLAATLTPILAPLVPLGIASALAQEGSLDLMLPRVAGESATELVDRLRAVVPVAAGLVDPVAEAFRSWARAHGGAA